ncbi:hypothetical protein UlMin_014829 [Ulmus minor]
MQLRFRLLFVLSLMLVLDLSGGALLLMVGILFALKLEMPYASLSVPWTEEEHKLFQRGLHMVWKGDWRGISRNFVKTHTPTQVASHAQKYFLRRNSLSRRRRRSSLFDITTETETLQKKLFIFYCNAIIPLENYLLKLSSLPVWSFSFAPRSCNIVAHNFARWSLPTNVSVSDFFSLPSINLNHDSNRENSENRDNFVCYRI